MSTEIAVVEKNNVLAEVERFSKIFEALMRLPHYQKMGADNVFAIVVKAESLDMDPIYALNGGLYAIKGKVGMAAESMAAMIRSKGHSITKDKSSTPTKCMLNGKRVDNGDTWSITFSIDDAKRAGIYGSSWEKYPETMCYNRAMSFLARQLFPDIIKGAGYIIEELKEIAGNHSQPQPSTIVDIEIVEEKPVQYINSDQVLELIDLLSDCSDDYRDKVMSSLKKLPKPIENLSNLPEELYDRIKTAAMKKRDEFQASKISMKEDLKEVM